MLSAGKHQPRPAAASPGDPVTESIVDAVCRVLELPADPSIEDDFFDDLGGSSLSAAELITELRSSPETSSLTVRDLYETRTVEQLALRVTPPRAEPDAAPPPQSAGNAVGVTVAQSLWLLLELAIASESAYLLFFRLLPWLSGRIGLIPLIVLAPFLLTGARVVFTPLAVAAAVRAKKVLIGRYTPTRTPVWSGRYVRMWIVRQFMRLIPWGAIAGTEFQCMALRALGARIGRRVHIHRGVDLLQGGWDLLHIGDDATISQDASLGLVQLEQGHVVLGPITLAEGATLDVRAGMGPGTRLGRGAGLTALSYLPTGGAVPDGQKWDGVPAQPAGPNPAPPAATDTGRRVSPVAHGVAMILSQNLLSWVMALPYTAAFALVAAHFDVTYPSLLSALAHPAANVPLFVTIGTSMCLALVCTVTLEAVTARVLGGVPTGVISRWSTSYLRVWLKTGLVTSAGTWLSGGLFWPVWLRAAGMTVGRDCEISTIIDAVPELIHIEPDCFLADGIYLGGPRIQHGTVTLANVVLDRNTFLGNHTVVAAGQRLPPDILIGISTIADDRVVRPGSSWFGHPPLELPRREIVAADRSLTHTPPFSRVITRVFWEWLRFTLPIVPMLNTVFWVFGLTYAMAVMPVGFALVFGVPAISLATVGLLGLFVLGLKWGLLGRVHEGTHPLWSCWCSRWDFLYVAWGVVASGLLSSLEGTLLLPVFLRRMGMQIGKQVVLGDGFAQVVDPDMLHIGDGATVNAMFQAHTFEDRVLKIGHIRMGAYSTLGAATVPLYGSAVGAHTYVAPHSVIMKHEHLRPGLRYEGAPTRRQQEDDSDSPVSVHHSLSE
jgi:non-ribosomal peptide synthetase-like protein